ncbi:hypothetical protein TNCV_4392941 [Trichonephila clavipes]|nr:hypothetical protein TNCV_4392941 [Trichonephila clavipes]
MPSCHSVHDLELAVEDLWAHLPQDNIRCLINSMPDSVALVWDVEGMALDKVTVVSRTGLALAGKGENIDTMDVERALSDDDATEVYRLLDVQEVQSFKGIGEDSDDVVTAIDDVDGEHTIYVIFSSVWVAVNTVDGLAARALITEFFKDFCFIGGQQIRLRYHTSEYTQYPGVHQEYSATASGRGSEGIHKCGKHFILICLYPPRPTKEAVCRSPGKTRHGAYLKHTQDIALQHQSKDPTGKSDTRYLKLYPKRNVSEETYPQPIDRSGLTPSVCSEAWAKGNAKGILRTPFFSLRDAAQDKQADWKTK